MRDPMADFTKEDFDKMEEKDRFDAIMIERVNDDIYGTCKAKSLKFRK